MLDEWHDCQAFVGSNVLLRKPARMRVAFSAPADVLCALAPILISETDFLLSELRQASEQQEVAHQPTGPADLGPEIQVGVGHFEFRLSVASVQAWFLRLLWH